MDKKASRLRRARKARAKIRQLGVARLSIHRTPRHIYAQVITADGGTVLAAASTAEKSMSEGLSGKTGNVDAATAVGKAIGERAKAAGVETVAFDRAGFKYHGRVKALADAAREAGLQF
jgi:large subunit ribosomal protein L18